VLSRRRGYCGDDVRRVVAEDGVIGGKSKGKR
jgi:hypothetical protein